MRVIITDWETVWSERKKGSQWINWGGKRGKSKGEEADVWKAERKDTKIKRKIIQLQKKKKKKKHEGISVNGVQMWVKWAEKGGKKKKKKREGGKFVRTLTWQTIRAGEKE